MSTIAKGQTVVETNYTDSLAIYGTASGGTSYTTTIFSGGVVVGQVNSGTRVTSSGGTLYNGYTAPTKTETVLSGADVRDLGVSFGGSLIVGNDAGVSNLTLYSGATATLDRFGKIYGAVVWAGAVIDMTAAYTTLRDDVNNYGRINGGIYGAGLLTNRSGGVISAQENTGSRVTSSGGILLNCSTTSGGRDVIANGGVAYDHNLTAGATLVVSGVVSRSTVAGVETVAAGGTVVSQTVNAGATVTMANGARIGGMMQIAAGATVSIAGDTGGTINLAGSDYTRLKITGSVMPSTVISGFNGTTTSLSDAITLTGIKKIDVLSVDYPSANHIRLRMRDGSYKTLNIMGIAQTGYALNLNSDGSVTLTACFLPGTLIATPWGDREVETLKPGDIVYSMTPDGQRVAAPIAWTGSGRQENAEGPDTQAVIVEKGAFGDNLPEQDLYLTPDHCVYVDGALVPVRMLVNHVSIRHDVDQRAYDYYHIMMNEHAVIFANGLPAESYFPDQAHGSNHFFDRDAFADSQVIQRHAERVAPLQTSREFVERIAHRLAKLATGSGITGGLSTREPDVSLRTDRGEKINIVRSRDSQLIFMIPANTRYVEIVSRADRPDQAIGPFIDDRRQLGVLVGRIELFQSNRKVQILDHHCTPYLAGWTPLETSAYRWTKGAGVIPLFDMASDSPSVLSIDIVDTSTYRIGQVQACAA